MIVDSQSPRADPGLLHLPGIETWMPHQLAIIEAARKSEQGEIPGVLASNLCAIVAPPGSGKTAIIAAMAASFEKPKESLVVFAAITPDGNRSVVLGRPAGDEGGNGKTLVVVPKSIVQQWRREIEAYGFPSDDVVFAWDARCFDRINNRDSYDAARLVVMADTFLHSHRGTVCESVYFKTVWDRVVVDEWHAIMSNVPRFNALFTWMVSASTVGRWPRRRNTSLVYDIPRSLRGAYASRHVLNAQQDGFWSGGIDLSDNDKACVEAATIVLHAEFGRESMSLPAPRMLRHECQMDAVSSFVSEYVPALRELVDAGAMAEDIRENMLDGAAEDQGPTVFDKVLESIDKDIRTQEACVAYQEALESAGVAAARDRLRMLYQRRERVVDAMTSDTTCPVCMEDEVPADLMVALGCRSTHFLCAVCTLALVKLPLGRRRCPLCCDPLDTLILPDRSAAAPPAAAAVTKIEKCLQLVEESQGPVIVYTSHASMVLRVTRVLRERGITAERLNLGGSISRILRDYEDRKIKVLVLDPRNPTGLNLQVASTVVIMNEVSSQVTQQVIGRAQRVGRGGQLHVHTLLYPGREYGREY